MDLYLRRKRNRRDYQFKKFSMMPQRMIMPLQTEPVSPLNALLGHQWSMPEPAPTYGRNPW